MDFMGLTFSTILFGVARSFDPGATGFGKLNSIAPLIDVVLHRDGRVERRLCESLPHGFYVEVLRTVGFASFCYFSPNVFLFQ